MWWIPVDVVFWADLLSTGPLTTGTLLSLLVPHPLHLLHRLLLLILLCLLLVLCPLLLLTWP